MESLAHKEQLQEHDIKSLLTENLGLKDFDMNMRQYNREHYS